MTDYVKCVAKRLTKIKTENGPTIGFSNMVVIVPPQREWMFNWREANERSGSRNSEYFLKIGDR